MLINFDLPERLIARNPSDKRDHCKMLVVDRSTGKITHTVFNQLSSILDEKYFLVLNDARVNPSRIFWIDPKNKKQEIVFLKFVSGDDQSSIWEAIVSGKNLKTKIPYIIDGSVEFQLLKDRENSIAHIQVNRPQVDVQLLLEQKGQLPLPPYILSKRKEDGIEPYTDQDKSNYQTVFHKQSGAVASPTAGLHFTDETFSALKQKGIDWDFIHLAVGWGTFAPLSQHHFETKKLHPEFCSVSPTSAAKILSAKLSGKKILAVGTTVVRTLESWAQSQSNAKGFEGETEIFITPPHDFKMSDAMLTNFHIPNSSLLLLVAAFLGKDGEKKIVEIYKEAIEKEYRFYSYGDCMLIL